MKAELILFNGKIITQDSKGTVAEAVAVDEGVVVAVGSSSSLKRLASHHTEKIDLNGKTVTPGIIDTHIHVLVLGYKLTGQILDLLYPKVEKIADIVRLVKRKIDELQEGLLVFGNGWDDELLQEKRKITRWDLDPVSPDNPVVLKAACPSYGVVNSYVLNEAGITKDTKPPPGGVIEKDPETGEPNGVLMYNAWQLIPDFPGEIPSVVSDLLFSDEKTGITIIDGLNIAVSEAEKAIVEANKSLLSEGVTAIKYPGLDEVALKAYKNLRMKGKLSVRSYLLYPGGQTVDNANEVVRKITRFGDDFLMVGGVKLICDGSAGGRTAWLYDDWNKDFTGKDVGNKGSFVTPPENLRNIIKIYHKANLQIGCHCIGDRGIDTYLQFLEEALKEHPQEDSRHSIIHCNLPTPNAMAKIKELGSNVVIEPTAAFMYTIGDLYAGNLGPERGERLIPFKTWSRKGFTVGNSSDYGSADYPPRIGLYSACTRRTLKGTYGWTPFGTEECISVEEALRNYTAQAAKCLFWEEKIGSLELGKYADFVVWDKDMYSIPPEELSDLKVEMTVVNGKTVYKA